MDTDPGILCFQHCRPVNVFCFDLPHHCPSCAAPLGNAVFALLPFRVPYPFVRAAQYPCCIVIKPTAGDFLHDYFNSKNLHIGVTNSSGIVFEFDKSGLQYGKGEQWNQCLIVEGEAALWKEHWDSTLKEVSQEECWTPQKYNESTFNCYSFVLAFLQRLNYGRLSEAAADRTDFCEKFIISRATAAGKYISLFRKIRQSPQAMYVH